MTNIYAQYKKKTFTVDNIMALKPCIGWTRQKVKRLFGEKKRLTVKQIYNLKISFADRFWLLLHLFDVKQRRALGYAFIRRTGVDLKPKVAYDKLMSFEDYEDYPPEFILGYETFWATWDTFVVLDNWKEVEEAKDIFEKYLRKYGYLEN